MCKTNTVSKVEWNFGSSEGALNIMHEIKAQISEIETDMKNQNRILVVDDEPDLCAILKEQLEGDGYEVDTATSVAEAKLMIDKCTYAILISDIQIGANNGKELVQAAIIKRPEMGHILMTANLDENDPKTLLKPFQAKELIAAIKNIQAKKK